MGCEWQYWKTVDAYRTLGVSLYSFLGLPRYPLIEFNPTGYHILVHDQAAEVFDDWKVMPGRCQQLVPHNKGVVCEHDVVEAEAFEGAE